MILKQVTEAVQELEIKRHYDWGVGTQPYGVGEIIVVQLSYRRTDIPFAVVELINYNRKEGHLGCPRLVDGNPEPWILEAMMERALEEARA